MSDQEQTLVEFSMQVGQMRDGTHGVSLSITTAGLTTFGVALPPAFARELGPQLAKELANAADAAEDADRKENGLIVAAGLPDALRKGH